MFICPTCNREFATEEEIKKHSLPCWKWYNPDCKSTPAPQGEDVVTREISNDIADFFKSFTKDR